MQSLRLRASHLEFNRESVVLPIRNPDIDWAQAHMFTRILNQLSIYIARLIPKPIKLPGEWNFLVW